MDIITIDGMVENDFRLSIEDMLRLDQVDEAVERLRGLLGSCAGEGKTLPARFLEVTADDLEIGGWQRLDDRLLDHGRSSFPITAIGMTLADARQLGGPRPSGGRLAPFIKTFYFTDDAYPFSEASRDDLLDGYSRDGFELQGDYRATDATLSVRGIDDLYGAIAELEVRLFDTPDPDPDEIRAGSIGSCFLATLIHQALRDTILRKGLPRRLCVFAACDGVYPYFDAPVIGSDECPVAKPDPALTGEDAVAGAVEIASSDPQSGEADVEDEEANGERTAEASLLSLGIRRSVKAPVMVLDAQDAEEAARCSEEAEAQRMGIAEGTLQRDVLEGFQFDQGPGDLELLERAADTAVQPHAPYTDMPQVSAETIVAPEEAWPQVGPLFVEALATDPPVGADAVEPYDPEQGIEAANDQADEPLQVGLTTPEMPIAAATRESAATPAAHSLRARLNAAQPQAAEGAGARLVAALARFWQAITRR